MLLSLDRSKTRTTRAIEKKNIKKITTRTSWETVAMYREDYSGRLSEESTQGMLSVECFDPYLKSIGVVHS